MQGKCPHCGAEGVVGVACAEKGCAAQGIHFVAIEFHKDLPSGILERDPLIGKKVEDYLIVRKLGEGGVGAVYLALQAPIMMKTALKLLKALGAADGAQDRIDSFKIEAQVLAQLTHPNIVRLIKYGVLDGVPYMAMEFVKDGTGLDLAIKGRFEDGGNFTFVEVRHIMTQMLHALAAAHDEGLIHRDLKPQNIMLQAVRGDPNFVRILDFGLAKFVIESPDTSMARGTPSYMATEQFIGKNIGPWTDLYAAGLILYELLTGRRAFADSYSTELMAKKMNPAHDPTEGADDTRLPLTLRIFIRKAAAADPLQRYQSAGQFLAAMNLLFVEMAKGGQQSLVLPVSGDEETIAAPTSEHSDLPEFGTHETMSASEVIRAGQIPTPSKAPFDPAFQFPQTVPGGSGQAVPQLPSTQPVVSRKKSSRLWWVLGALAVGAALTVGGYFAYQAWTLKTTGTDEAAKQEVAQGVAGAPKHRDVAQAEPEIRDFPEGKGTEFRINEFTKNRQENVEVAVFPDGHFLAAWQSSHQDGSGNGIFFRLYNSDGKPATDEIQANTYTTGHQEAPRIVPFADGRFTLIWHGEGQDGDGWGVFGRRFTAKGQRNSPLFTVNSHTKKSQQMARVAPLTDERFVVVWQSNRQDGDGEGVFGQRFDAATKKLGPEFQVNSVTEGDQKYPGVAPLSNGGFAVVWEGENPDGDSWDVYLRRFGPDGKPLAEETMVNKYDRDGQRWPVVASLPNDRLVVSWTSDGQDGSGRGVYGRLIDADGKPTGDEFTINTNSEADQTTSLVAAIGEAGFVCFWTSERQDGSAYGAFGQLYHADGTLWGPEFQVNEFTEADQMPRAVAGFPDGRIIFVWDSDVQDGSGMGVYGRIVSVNEDGTIR